MKSQWSETEASAIVAEYACSEDMGLRTYSARLIGAERTLVLHGGGNTSVKGTVKDELGHDVPAVFVKASGHDLATIDPDGHAAIRLDDVRRLRGLDDLSDVAMANAIRTRLFDASAAPPSIEALMHAFIPAKFVDHTHADVILALSNQKDGRRHVEKALGDDVPVLDYVRPGFALACAVADAIDALPSARGIVLAKHGLVTWGETARESYDRTIDLVSRAEKYLKDNTAGALQVKDKISVVAARANYLRIASIIRGSLAIKTDDPDWPYDRFVLDPLITREALDFVGSDSAKALALTPPLTTDHLIRTKAFPLLIVDPNYDAPEEIDGQLSEAIAAYRSEYKAYLKRHASRMPAGIEPLDSMPRVIMLPGVGAVCAGANIHEARVVRDITEQTIAVKSRIAALGVYEGLDEEHLFDMEYHVLQHAKLDRGDEQLLGRSVALVTGAAGAIGAGVCEALLDAGCHVAVSDLAGDRLQSLVARLQAGHSHAVTAVPLDVTDPAAVAEGFDQVIATWGGVDLVILNAGLAHVSSLADMDADAFARLERVNIEGTRNVLAESARRFRVQGTGGDIVLVSTKNVFAPGAGFGAYSATKAAAHQLARIASLELASFDIRVNMVSPDAVFSHGDRRSGLWEEVGPDRMQARGLDEKGLEEYYRKRNLLKARVTATHVARSILFFAARETPTTGATLPVDGGLPDATPR